ALVIGTDWCGTKWVRMGQNGAVLNSKLPGSFGCTGVHAAGEGVGRDCERWSTRAGPILVRRTRALFKESLALFRGCLALDQDDFAAARFRNSLALRRKIDMVGFVHTLAALASLAAAEGSPEHAVYIAGVTAALTQCTGVLVQHSERGRCERWVATAQQALGE